MTNCKRALQMIDTLRKAAEAAYAPEVPNGTTRKLQSDIEVHVENCLDDLAVIAWLPKEPNGTTKKVQRILEDG